MRSSSGPTLLASRLWYCWKTTRSSDPIIGSNWSRMHKEIWGSVFLTWSRKIWKAEDFHAFPCGIFTSTSAQMLNPILRKEKVHVYRKYDRRFWHDLGEQSKITVWLTCNPFFSLARTLPLGERSRILAQVQKRRRRRCVLRTSCEGKTTKDCRCKPSKTMRYTLKEDDLFMLDAIGWA